MKHTESRMLHSNRIHTSSQKCNSQSTLTYKQQREKKLKNEEQIHMNKLKAKPINISRGDQPTCECQVKSSQTKSASMKILSKEILKVNPFKKKHTHTGRRWNNHEFAVKQIASTKKSIENAQCNYGIIQLLHFALARTYNKHSHTQTDRHTSMRTNSKLVVVVCCSKVISGAASLLHHAPLMGHFYCARGACICVCNGYAAFAATADAAAHATDRPSAYHRCPVITII